MKRSSKLLIAAGAAVIPLALYANSGAVTAAPSPPLKRTGASVDGGLSCVACHGGAAVNSDSRGKFTLTAAGYKPGVKQTITVKLEHPDAARWGFQLTARSAKDLSKSVGTFTENENVKVRCDDGVANTRGVTGPCDGRLEFAMHTLASTYATTRGSVEWLVDWTPPPDDAGDVVFYAAGNAANNSATNQGDLIYTTELRIENAGACPLTQRPTLRTVVNGASFQTGAGMNAFVSVYGAGFAQPGMKRTAGIGDMRNGKFPTELACVAVEIGGVRAPLLYVQPDQINAQAPSISSQGPVNVRVIANPDRPNQMLSDLGVVPFGEYHPALFTFDGTRVAATHADGSLLGDPSRVTGATPARPGEVITFYGTGFGATEPFFQAGELASGIARVRDPLTVTIGGTTLASGDVAYAGLSPQSVSALYQFNVRLPATLSTGEVPVYLTIGGLQTQTGVVIPVLRPQ